MTPTYELETLTPLFSTGSYTHRAEIRPASIRGQLHWWFRALHHSTDLENAGTVFQREKRIFGGLGGKHTSAEASRLIVRVSPPTGALTSTEQPTLPHKQGNHSAPKVAIPPGTRFQVHLQERRDGLSDDDRQAVQRTVRAWILLGALGNRSTRGAGSLLCHNADFPLDRDVYEAEIASLLEGSAIRAAVLDERHSNAEAARTVCTNTIGGINDSGRKGNQLKSLLNPLGGIGRELARELATSRKTSPLKLRVSRFRDAFRIVAVWDGRKPLTGNSWQHLEKVIKLLQESDKPIGGSLAGAKWV